MYFNWKYGYLFVISCFLGSNSARNWIVIMLLLMITKKSQGPYMSATCTTYCTTIPLLQNLMRTKTSAEKFPGGTKKRPKNSTITLLSTMIIPWMKIQRVYGHLPPAADALIKHLRLSINRHPLYTVIMRCQYHISLRASGQPCITCR